jgi:hypothetical protein
LPLQLQGQGLDALGRHRLGQWRQGGAGHGEGGGSFPIMIAGWSLPSPVDALGASCEATDGEDNQLPTSVVNDSGSLAWSSYQGRPALRDPVYKLIICLARQLLSLHAQEDNAWPHTLCG